MKKFSKNLLRLLWKNGFLEEKEFKNRRWCRFTGKNIKNGHVVNPDYKKKLTVFDTQGNIVDISEFAISENIDAMIKSKAKRSEVCILCRENTIAKISNSGKKKNNIVNMLDNIENERKSLMEAVIGSSDIFSNKDDYAKVLQRIKDAGNHFQRCKSYFKNTI